MKRINIIKDDAVGRIETNANSIIVFTTANKD